LVAKLGDVVRVVADDERSQARNRALALERLRQRLVEGLRVERPRRATKPSRASGQRRLETKKKRSDAKRSRSWRPDD
jgi:ribosome-associated protein